MQDKYYLNYLKGPHNVTLNYYPYKLRLRTCASVAFHLRTQARYADSRQAALARNTSRIAETGLATHAQHLFCRKLDPSEHRPLILLLPPFFLFMLHLELLPEYDNILPQLKCRVT